MKKRSVRKLFLQLAKRNKKAVAWLIDPDKLDSMDFSQWNWVKDSKLDLILVGGSRYVEESFDELVEKVQLIAGNIPVVLFPGSHGQVSGKADGILFMSLLSGRNPDFLISQQVDAAFKVYESELEVLPTAYILVNDGELKSVHRESNTLPISNQRPDIVLKTALAGTYLGMTHCFLDAGSGATSCVSAEVIQTVKSHVQIPLIVGGGLDTLSKIHSAMESGANMVVIGNQIEKDPDFLTEVLSYKEWYNQSLHVN